MNLFCFTLKDVILECQGENFMQSHPRCTFLELEVAFCKCYYTIQNDEPVYMAFRVIKQGYDEKVDIHPKWILKFATILNIRSTTTCWQLSLSWFGPLLINRNDNNETKYFIQAQGIYGHLWRDYGRWRGVPKLLKPLKKLEKTLDNIQIEKMCNFYYKPGHLKER